jgi:hypothetical protein
MTLPPGDDPVAAPPTAVFELPPVPDGASPGAPFPDPEPVLAEQPNEQTPPMLSTVSRIPRIAVSFRRLTASQ